MDHPNFKLSENVVKYKEKTTDFRIIYSANTSPENADHSLNSSKADVNENGSVLKNSDESKNKNKKCVGLPEESMPEISPDLKNLVNALAGINNNADTKQPCKIIMSLNQSLNKGSDNFISQVETAQFTREKLCQRDCKEANNGMCICARSANSESKSKGIKENCKPCDSFGQIEFKGFISLKTNPLYVRICHKTNHKDVWDMMIKCWKMPPPKLLISVTGGAKKFELKPRLSSLLKQGLLGSAVNTGAWIITGGTKSGVMEFVGVAVKDHMNLPSSIKKGTCVALGIAPWGVVQNKKALANKEDGHWPANYENTKCSQKMTHIDPNHTHFLLVDNGTEGKFDVENEFRSDFEKFISDDSSPGTKIPVVLVVIEGGLGTIKTVQKVLEKGTPVVIVKGSGRAADFLAYAYEEAIKSLNGNKILNLTKEFENKMKEEVKKVYEKNTKQMDAIESVKKCLGKHNLMSVFDLEKSESVKDIDKEILCALLKTNNSDCRSQLNLAMAWNRSDIAQKKILTVENRENLKPEDLYDAMFTALVEDKTEFVQLILDYGVDIKKFLTIEKLEKLYIKCDNSGSSEATFFKNLIANEEQSLLSLFKNQSHDDQTNKFLSLQSVNNVLVRLLNDESFDFYSDKRLKEKEIKMSLCCQSKIEGSVKTYNEANEERDLFIFAIFFNRRKMADLFLKLGVDQLGTSLLGCSVLKALSVKAESHEETALSNSFLTHSQILENFAIAVLNECYMCSKLDAHALLYREMKQLGNIPILVLAERQQLMDFAEHPACQTILTRLWKGDISPQTSQFRIILTSVLPFLIVFMKFHVPNKPEEPDSKLVKSNQVNVMSFETSLPSSKKHVDELSNFTKFIKVMVGCSGVNTNNNRLNVFRALYMFYSAPVTKFTTNIMAYIILLGLFSYFLLTNIQPVSEPNSPSVIEYIVWAWFGTMFLEEIRQVSSVNQRSIKYKFSSWFRDLWNRFDLLTFISLIVSIILRYQLEMDRFVYTRVVYSITLLFTYLRFMQFYFAQPDMGPKVIMIRRMLTDLSFFFFILLVFVLGFGVAYHINMFPNQPLSWSILYTVFLYPYFQIYGELFLDELGGKIADGDGCTSNRTIWLEDPSQRCPEKNAIVYIFLAVYLVLTNILLINLLIAMFSYTFQKVQENSTKVWRFYRISLVYEYFDRPSLVPPFIIINLIWRMIRSCIPGLNIGTHIKFGITPTFDENEKLRLFEKSAVDTHLAQSSVKERELLDFRVASTLDRLDLMMSDLQKIKEAVQSGTQLVIKQGITNRSLYKNTTELEA